MTYVLRDEGARTRKWSGGTIQMVAALLSMGYQGKELMKLNCGERTRDDEADSEEVGRCVPLN